MPGRIFLHAYAVTVLNLKCIVFFVAFPPQFIVPSSPFLLQIVIFKGTFLVTSSLNALTYALMPSGARRPIRKPAVRERSIALVVRSYTFASAPCPCGDTLFLRGLPSETKPALFPENESDCRFVPLPSPTASRQENPPSSFFF